VFQAVIADDDSFIKRMINNKKAIRDNNFFIFMAN